ncbi:uncharacterized protein LOC104905560 [Beta vulgaris subsp. vulgaris]|uniref:uncharacterized protein LOC104905560 n=1 Tax=Beta vulgaris subsp. vulgaris TaxID=3555 RepID=UPI0020373A08|nr:uncharacterized protein LOC104905560 [Beta vulgaris subsp. vulgaris]
MALIVDPQSNFKHFCKICKKGFMCGRALGGHMRAHGIGDESGALDDDDPASDWEDKGGGGGGGGGGGNTPPSNKRMYALRTNPNRLRSCRVCENCGKEFLSWKSFLEHGKCSSSDDAESLVSSHGGSDGEDDGGGGNNNKRASGSGWSKRKRSFRTKVGSLTPNCPSSEEEDLANCLMMLSNATVDYPLGADQSEESCASASKEEADIRRHSSISFLNATYMSSSRGTTTSSNYDLKAKGVVTTTSNNPNSKGLFECKACKRTFNSHQALGGHRASHKKVKGCYAAKMDQVLYQDHHCSINNNGDNEDNNLAVLGSDQDHLITKSCTTYQLENNYGASPSLPLVISKRPKSKVHECSICHRVFSSGQALGGHKRCHWITSNNAPDASTLATFQQLHDQIDQQQQRVVPMFAPQHSISEQKALDLNFPAPPNNDPLSFHVVSTDILLKSWGSNGGVNLDIKCQEGNYQQIQGDHDEPEKNKKTNYNNHKFNTPNIINNVDDDEADSKLKLAKLCELKDNTNGTSSPWLQVGIGTTNAVKANP